MKIDLTSIGYGIFIACLGVTAIIDSVSDSNRREECDKRGGYIAKVDDSWLRSEKKCVIDVPKVGKP